MDTKKNRSNKTTQVIPGYTESYTRFMILTPGFDPSPAGQQRGSVGPRAPRLPAAQRGPRCGAEISGGGRAAGSTRWVDICSFQFPKMEGLNKNGT